MTHQLRSVPVSDITLIILSFPGRNVEHVVHVNHVLTQENR